MPTRDGQVSDNASDDDNDRTRPEVRVTDEGGVDRRPSLPASSASSSTGDHVQGTWIATEGRDGKLATMQSGTKTAAARMYRRRVSRTTATTRKVEVEEDIAHPRPGRRYRRVFQALCRVTVIYLRVRNTMLSGSEYRKQVEHVQYARSAAEAAESAAMFDPSEFKAKRQMRTTTEVKRILQKTPWQRSETEVYYATIALRGLKLISDYPLKMQQNLARYGHFESYAPGRVVIKEGHRPYAFYFIIYGSVIVAVFNENTNEADTKCILKRDESFGELAIMNQSARQSTVITKDYTEFLSIDSEIYEKIFMVGGRKLVSDPAYRHLIESLTFLRDWPTSLLLTTSDPKLLVFAYFKRGSVMMRDSNHSDWLYIIKSGSVDIVKKLVRPRDNSNAVKAFLTGGNGNSCWVDCTQRVPHRLRRPQSIKDRIIAFEDVKVASRIGSFRRPTHDNEPTLVTETRQHDGNELASLPLKPGSIAVEMAGSAVSVGSPDWSTMTASDQRRLRSRAQSAAAVVGHQTRSSSDGREIQASGQLGKYQQSPAYGATIDKIGRNPQSAMAGNRSVQWNQLESQRQQGRQGTRPPTSKSDQRRRMSTVITEQTVAETQYAERRTFIDDLDKWGKDKANAVVTEADRHPAFIRIQTLTKGDVFGLTAMTFDNQPSLCLISNGAECIMINKQFFSAHCSEEKLFKLQMEVSPYPTEDQMQSDLIAHVNWLSYKTALVESIVSRRQRPQIIG